MQVAFRHLERAPEVLLRTLVACLLPDYLRGQPSPRVEERLGILERPLMGKWLDLARELTRALAARREPAPALPEAGPWLAGHDAALGRAIALRNDEEHGAPPLSDSAAAGRCAQLLEALRGPMRDLGWMAGYRLFRVVGAKLTRSRTIQGSVALLMGEKETADPLPLEWKTEAMLVEDAVYLASPAGDATLDLTPFVVWAADRGTPQLYLFHEVPKMKRLALRNDARSDVIERSPEIEGKAVPFDAWLSRRTEVPDPWQRVATLGAGLGDARTRDEETGGLLGQRFEVREKLGQGAMATVYRVCDRHFGEEGALKVMSTLLADDPRYRERFKREARYLRLTHENLVSVRDSGELEGENRLFLLMDVVEGGSLEEQIDAGGRPAELVAQWAEGALRALEFLHGRKIVHRDVKPSNLLLTSDGRVVLTDFGVARQTTDGKLTSTIDGPMGTDLGTARRR